VNFFFSSSVIYEERGGARSGGGGGLAYRGVKGAAFALPHLLPHGSNLLGEVPHLEIGEFLHEAGADIVGVEYVPRHVLLGSVWVLLTLLPSLCLLGRWGLLR